ncbi:MAG: hypothetical protein WD716_07720 [Fimbriimonadaceae bacterium]
MKFYVISSDGRKFGPADVQTLNQWVRENRLNRDTMLENADTGQQLHARDVPGLQFIAAAADLGGADSALKAGEKPLATTSFQTPGNPYVAGHPEQHSAPAQSQYASPPQPGSPYPRAAGQHDDGSAKMITSAWILIVVGFLTCCLFVTPFGIGQANKAKKMGNPNANAPFIVGWILFALQLLGAALYLALVIMAVASTGPSPTF